MAAYDINPSPDTQDNAGVPPAPPEANHQAGVVETQEPGFEVVDDELNQFFAPVSSDVIDGLLGQYQARRSRIEHLARVIADDMGAVHYFLG